uniref:Uncharacterized protein n=1 Tax=Hyaloperonospora arabidopsidis (strain Emoy2) TaxID=559515 RepID=M4C0J5_HYAAE
MRYLCATVLNTCRPHRGHPLEVVTQLQLLLTCAFLVTQSATNQPPTAHTSVRPADFAVWVYQKGHRSSS